MDARAQLDALAKKHLPAVLQLIDEVVVSSSPAGSPLVSMCRYHMETGGKRLRALTPFWVAESLGALPERVTAFAAACEMLHNATLVHDDLQDGDAVRRGRPTVWKAFGVPQAINLGDAMFYYAALLVGRLEEPREVRERALHRLLVDTIRVIDGQEREFALRHVERPTLEEYMTMVEGKTSAMFALPLAGTAELVGAPKAVVEGLESVARHLGVLFQVQDDVLDIYGEKGRDQRGSDIAEGKRSFLVVHALTHAPATQAAWLRGVLDAPRESTLDSDIEKARALFDEVGALDAALSEIKRRARLAFGELAAQGQKQLASLVGDMARLFCAPIEHLAPGLLEQTA